MSNKATIITGDDAAIPVQLKKGGSTFVIDSGATVEAQLRKADNAIGTKVTVLEATNGSAWATSLVVPVFPSSDTVNFTVDRDYYLSMEIQVNESGVKTTWILDNIANVRKGLIA